MVSYAEDNAKGKFGIAEDLNIKHIQEVLSMTQKPQNADAASEIADYPRQQVKGNDKFVLDIFQSLSV